MSRSLILLAIGCCLSSCAHLIPPRAAFDCVDQLDTKEREITTTRVLDKNGRQLSVEARWFEKSAKPRGIVIGAAWFGAAGDPDLSSNHVVLSFDHAPNDKLHWLGGVELRTGSPETPATESQFINRKRVNTGVYPSWPTLEHALQSGAPLFLVLLNRNNRIYRAEPINRDVFGSAIADVRASLARSQAQTQNPTVRCTPHEVIIVT